MTTFLSTCHILEEEEKINAQEEDCVTNVVPNG